MRARLARVRHHVLGGLAGEEGVEPELDRLAEARRRAAGDDADAPYQLRPRVPAERSPLGHALHPFEQLGGRDALAVAADEADGATVVHAARLRALEAERLAEQRIVAHLRVGVERQVVAGE